MTARPTFADVLTSASAAGFAPAKEAGVNSFRATCPKCGASNSLRIQPTPEASAPADLWCDGCKRLPLSILGTRGTPPARALKAKPSVSIAPVVADALARSSPDGRVVVQLRRDGSKSTPLVTVRCDTVLTVSDECFISRPTARESVLAQCPAATRVWLLGALKELSEAWTITRHAETSKPAGSDSRLTKDVEPWPDAVDLADVLDDLLTHVRQYLILPEYGPEVVTLWCALTHWIDALRRVPYLWVHSPVRQCGKSTVLDIAKQLCRRPWGISNPSGAALFRTIEAERPTVLLDEFDAIKGPKLDDITLVMNDGFQVDGKVPRCVGDKNEVVNFSVFSAKLIAGIGKTLPDATRSRCIQITMQRGDEHELAALVPFREDAAARWSQPVRRKLARAAADSIDLLRGTLQDPDAVEIPSGVYGRDSDVWEPMLALADLAGGQWPLLARSACVAFVRAQRADDDGDTKIRLLRDLKLYFCEPADDRATARDTTKATSAQLITWLTEDETRGWTEYKGRELSPHALARLLKPFNVAPVKQREGSATVRVWLHADLVPVWSKYLPLPPAKESATSATSAQLVPDVALVALVSGRVGAEEMFT